MAKYNSSLKYDSGLKYNTWGIALFYSVMESIGIQEAVHQLQLKIQRANEILSVNGTFGGTAHWLRLRVQRASESLSVSETLGKVAAWIRNIAEAVNIVDIAAPTRDLVKMFADCLFLRDRWRRWRYNSGIKYNQGKRYGGYVAYVVNRRRHMLVNLSLALKEKIRSARVRFRHVSETQVLVESLNRAIGKWRSIILSFAITEFVSHTRNRIYSVIDNLSFLESISRLRQALLTLLGKAQTRFSFVARAVAVERFLGIAKTIVENVTALDMVTVVGAKIQTRQVIYCQLGGGDALVKLDIFRGNDKTFELNVKDESGVNLDLTGATVIFMVKQTVKDADIDAVIIKTSADETEIKLTQPILGTCEIYLKPDDTKNLPVKHYVYEAQVITAGGRKYTVAMDEFILKHVVKRD